MPTHTHDDRTPEQAHPGQSCDQHDVETLQKLNDQMKVILNENQDVLRRLAQS